MKTHYDVLHLGKNCTAKEIKDSFIKLSKEFHPDLNKSSDAHKRFVEVNEAYSVLGNANSRHKYDATLSLGRTTPVYQTTTTTYRTSSYDMKTPYEFYGEYYGKQRQYYDQRAAPHFTPSKVKLITFCILIMVFGSGLQLIAQTKRRAHRSQEIARSLQEARNRRCRLGPEESKREFFEALRKK